MKQFNLLPILLIITIISFIGLFFVDILLISKNFPNASRIVTYQQIPIYQGNSKVSDFISTESNLNLIYIKFKNVEVLNNDPFVFQLLDSNNNLLREIRLTGYNIGDDEWVKFQFAPIIDSKNRIFKIVLSSETKDLQKSVIRVSVDKEGEIIFRSYSGVRIFTTLNEQANQFLKRFQIDKTFFYFYLCLLGIIVFGIISLRFWAKDYKD